MGRTDFETIDAAAAALNRGDTGPLLDLCDPEPVLRVTATPDHPAGRAFFGRQAIRDVWRRAGAGVTVRPVDLLAGGGYLVVVVEVVTGRPEQPTSRRWIVTAAGEGGLWREIWLQPADEP
ncbi:MAG TPA: nuclear transport factor 2 family protein [Actinomycetota bacterium]|nr:nuclear transport factor 2 family protein [Actinomycetota bacterium]